MNRSPLPGRFPLIGRKLTLAAVSALTSVLALAPSFSWGQAPLTNAEREEIARQIKPVLADPPADGLLIFQVEPKSQAERAGLQPGDILTLYDGQPVTTVQQLVQLARDAAQNKRDHLLIVARRGEEEIDAQFDPAPLGVRLVAVRKGEGRTLWRPAQEFQPQLETLDRLVSQKERWEVLVRGGAAKGWVHYYFAKHDGKWIMRAQSRIKDQALDEKRDAVLSFDANAYLSPRDIRLQNRENLILQLQRQQNTFKGERAGIPVSAGVPGDAVSIYLSGHVAAMMPRQRGACLHCSLLEEGSLVAAPFAEVFCLGEEELQMEDQKMKAAHYELTVFGDTLVDYWIDDQRDIVQVLYGNGVRAVRSTRETVLQHFPDAEREFEPIVQIPRNEPPKAN